MNYFFNELFAKNANELTLTTTIITIIVALILGTIISYTYFKTQNEVSYQRNLAITLFMLPIILSVIIIFVGSNIARAFSLAGTLSIIRFRSAPGDAKDIGFIFFDIAAGLSCGVGLYGYGILFTLVLCVAIIIIEKTKMFEKDANVKTLKITIPEDLNYEGAFEEILNKYTTSHTLYKIKTTDLGSLFEVCYTLTMKKGVNDHEFLDEIRCRNGNLNIILSQATKSVK